MPDTDTPKPINIRNMDPADRQALRHAAVDAGTNLTEYIRRLCHAEAERLRAKRRNTSDTTHRFEATITGIDQHTAGNLWGNFVDAIETEGGLLVGGHADEPPNT